MTKLFVCFLVLTGCGSEPFNFSAVGAVPEFDSGVRADAGDSAGGLTSAGGSPAVFDAGSGGAPGVEDGGVGGTTSAGGQIAVGGGGDGSGGTVSAGGTPGAGGVAVGAGGVPAAGGQGAGGVVASGGVGTGGAPPELCCKFALSGAPATYLSCSSPDAWLCSGAQTYSCGQDGLCTTGAVCYVSGGPYGGVVAPCR